MDRRPKTIHPAVFAADVQMASDGSTSTLMVVHDSTIERILDALSNVPHKVLSVLDADKIAERDIVVIRDFEKVTDLWPGDREKSAKVEKLVGQIKNSFKAVYIVPFPMAAKANDSFWSWIRMRGTNVVIGNRTPTIIETGASKIIVTQSGISVMVAIQGGIGAPQYNGDFLSIENTEKLIVALQGQLDIARADYERGQSITPEIKQAMIDRALGLA